MSATDYDNKMAIIVKISEYNLLYYEDKTTKFENYKQAN